MNKYISLPSLLVLIVSPFSLSYGNTLFSAQDNHLYVPYIAYQGQNYQAEFLLQNSNQLELLSLVPRASKPTSDILIRYSKKTLIKFKINNIINQLGSNLQILSSFN